MRRIETAPAKTVWVIGAIYIWLKHNRSDKTVEVPSPKHLKTEYSPQTSGVAMMWWTVSGW